LETYSLKQQLEQARQELSHSLYQHEAACRVIARLVKERDAARQMLSQFTPNIATAPSQEAAVVPTGEETAPESMDVDESGAGTSTSASLSQEVLDKIIETSQGLQKSRRKRPLPETLATPEQVSSFKQLSSTALHSASTPGITSVDLHPDGVRVLTAGLDKSTIVFDRSQEIILHTLKGHTKRVNIAIFHRSENLIFTASQDKTARIWHAEEGKSYKALSVIKSHKADVTDLSLHATGDFIGTSSLDSTWSIIDIRTGQVLVNVTSPEVTKGYTKAQFHPDGLILGSGTVDSVVRMWDVKSLSNVAKFEAHAGKITDLAFSENGYYLATAAEDSTVKLWDLRKLTNFKTIDLEEGQNANALDFDYSGSYLAFGSASSVKIFGVKNWNELVHLTDQTGIVTDIKFDKDAHAIASVGMDRTLKTFGI